MSKHEFTSSIVANGSYVCNEVGEETEMQNVEMDCNENLIVQSRIMTPLNSGSRQYNLGKENVAPNEVLPVSLYSPSTSTPMIEGFKFKRSRYSTEVPWNPSKSNNVNSTPINNNFPFYQSESPTVKSPVAVMQTVKQMHNDRLLIGDGSKRYILPIIGNGKLGDLQEISGHTLIALLHGKYDNLVDHYNIIDCRYPYEYEGGHIQGALNLYTQKQIYTKYLESKITCKSNHTLNTNKERVILIFHCEFSSHRGPGMCRFLRESDRACNKDTYPCLHYPELYVLNGGYKLFYKNHQEYCNPFNYIPMKDPLYTQSLRLYESESKNQLIKCNSSKQLKSCCKKISSRKYEIQNENKMDSPPTRILFTME